MLAVIMAGGSGTRFWPLSRKDRPKQFLNITGAEPMLVETCNRLRPLISDDRMVVVLGREHLEEAGRLLKGRPVHLVAEPVGRNTAPCIGLGAVYALHLGHSDPVAFLPADHHIGDPAAFLEDLRRAAVIAAEGGIVTLGIVPQRPETGYGYIRREPEAVVSKEFSAYRVAAFVEKPDPETARRYVVDGAHYWNAGIFVASPATILAETARHLPELHQGLLRLQQALGEGRLEAALAAQYEGFASVSFDYGIMEKTGSPVHVIPSNCGWSDVGSWESLYELRGPQRDAHQNLSDGEALIVDCQGSFVAARGKRLVACLGLKNCLVVDTPDSLLVADLRHSQDIRELVARLKRQGKEELL